MELKQTIEGHPVVIFFIVAFIAFGAGWGANTAVQSASGLTAIPIEKAKLADTLDAERQEFRAKLTMMKEEQDHLREKLAQLESNSPSSRGVPNKQTKSSSTTSAKTPHMGVPLSADIKDVSIPSIVQIVAVETDPPGAALIAVGVPVTVRIVYVVSPGRTVNLWAYPEVGTKKDIQFTHEPSQELSGSGVINRWFKVNTPTRVHNIVVTATSGSQDEVVLKRLPVDYTFR